MAEPGKQMEFKIQGMDCAEEITVLRKEIGPIAGGEGNLSFDLLNGKMTVASKVSPDRVIEAVKATGMRAEPWAPTPSRLQQKPGGLRLNRTVLTSVSGLFLAAGFGCHSILSGGVSAALGSEGMGIASGVPWAAKGLYLLGILAGAWAVLPKAWLAAKRLRPDMNLLMTLAVLGAIAIGEWFEASTVAFLFSLSLALEAWSVGRARRAVSALLDLVPDTVHLLMQDGRDLEVAPETVVVGARFRVKPGERIPLDGSIRKGTSEVNQAPITGESMPVEKQVGDTVFAGTINGNGGLEIESTHPSNETTLARVIRLVGESQSRRGIAEQWIEKFARIYTPTVLLAALGVFLVPSLAFGGQWLEWFYRSLVFLVIGCPCALVISTPVSIVAALTASARNGVLVKGGMAMEIPARLRAIALDKTGTLTRGKPMVEAVASLNGFNAEYVLELASSLEAHGDHPLAQAIVVHARERGMVPRPVEGFSIVQGKGAKGTIDGKEIWLGSHRHLEELGAETPAIHALLEKLSAAGNTVVAVGSGKTAFGCIALADLPRPEAKETVAELKRLGVGHVIMLTGDNRGTAGSIAGKTGVDAVRSELLPQDKVKVIEELVGEYGAVAMVGDGINDAPALAQATLGIAMGAAGSDAAIESADIALMSDDISKIPWLIRHSRRTRSIIFQNVGLSLAVKALFVLLTLAGVSSLWGAIAADMGASLLVVFNALRLLNA